MEPISTRLGQVQGFEDGGIAVFRGLRYANAPIGDRRFLPPEPSVGWSGECDATRWPNRCPQPPMSEVLGPADPGDQDEDCLFLNIATPGADGGTRPVMVWIHGGGFTTGSANAYDGSILAAQGDVVVVAINYRLGLLGFMDLSAHGDEFAGSASNGIRDQIAALEWVRDNITDYGGDPGNVTIFGESAGGGSILGLLASPAADGLYHKAIAHSPGGCSTPPVDISALVAASLELDTDDLVAGLRSASTDDLITAHQALGGLGGGCVDGTVVTRLPAKAITERGAAGVPLIAGTNRDEGTLFSAIVGGDENMMGFVGPILASNILDGGDATEYLEGLRSNYPDDSATQHFERIWVDLFRRPSINCAGAATEAGPGGWLYRFDLPSTAQGGKLGATHASEIAFTFNAFTKEGADPIAFHDRNDPAVRDLAQRWSDTVVAFARTGDPNSAGLPEWPNYRPDDRRCLVLDADPRMEADLDGTHRKLWGDAD